MGAGEPGRGAGGARGEQCGPGAAAAAGVRAGLWGWLELHPRAASPFATARAAVEGSGGAVGEE